MKLSFDVQEQLKENPEVTLLVEFYTVWSPPCKKLAEPFAEVSLRYKKTPSVMKSSLVSFLF